MTLVITVLSILVIYFVRMNPIWIILGSALMTLSLSHLGLISF